MKNRFTFHFVPTQYLLVYTTRTGEILGISTGACPCLRSDHRIKLAAFRRSQSVNSLPNFWALPDMYFGPTQNWKKEKRKKSVCAQNMSLAVGYKLLPMELLSFKTRRSEPWLELHRSGQTVTKLVIVHCIPCLMSQWIIFHYVQQDWRRTLHVPPISNTVALVATKRLYTTLQRKVGKCFRNGADWLRPTPAPPPICIFRSLRNLTILLDPTVQLSFCAILMESHSDQQRWKMTKSIEFLQILIPIQNTDLDPPRALKRHNYIMDTRPLSQAQLSQYCCILWLFKLESGATVSVSYFGKTEQK
jgi:hypothetical protein